MGILDRLFGRKEKPRKRRPASRSGDRVKLRSESGERITVPRSVANAMLGLQRKGYKTAYRKAGSGRPQRWKIES